MNDTIIFLVLAGVALLFRLFGNMASRRDDSDQSQPNEQSSPRRPAAQSEEERVRKFLEALGVPPGERPPPPARRRTVSPIPSPPPARARPARPEPKARRSWAQPLPPLTTAPPKPAVTEADPAPPVVAGPPPLPPTPLAVPVTSLPPIAARPAPARRALPATDSVGAMLRARGSIRRAIILREVLGPPRGLQGFEEFRGI